MSTSLNLTKKFEDASALVYFVGTGFLSSLPDEEQCNELGCFESSSTENRSIACVLTAKNLDVVFVVVEKDLRRKSNDHGTNQVLFIK